MSENIKAHFSSVDLVNHNKRPTIRYFLKNILFKYPTGAIGEVFLTILSQLLIILQIFLSVNVFIAYSWQFFIFIFRALIYLNRYILLN